jgi:hypothetical protein
MWPLPLPVSFFYLNPEEGSIMFLHNVSNTAYCCTVKKNQTWLTVNPCESVNLFITVFLRTCCWPYPDPIHILTSYLVKLHLIINPTIYA